MGEKGVSEACTNAAVENLASCATDGSMEVKVGCCSEDCASGIKKVSVPQQHAGCWWWGLPLRTGLVGWWLAEIRVAGPCASQESCPRMFRWVLLCA